MEARVVVQRNRNADSWEQLYGRLRPQLVRALTAVSGGFEGVEDAVQTAFLSAIRRDVSRDGPIEGWLFVTGLNELRRQHRRDGFRRPLTISPGRELEQALDRIELIRLLRQLEERDRTLLVAKYYLGLEQHEIAQVLGMPRGTVAAAISRACKRLRALEESRP
jgi:RNA polymerase sigma factor (sigma-70 family)